MDGNTTIIMILVSLVCGVVLTASIFVISTLIWGDPSQIKGLLRAPVKTDALKTTGHESTPF